MFGFPAPPPYMPPTSIAQQQMSQIRTAMAQPELSAPEGSDPAETERLRNFLIFCLAFGYQFNTAVALTPADHQHYTTMSVILNDVRNSHSETWSTEDDGKEVASYFWKYLHAPCQDLTISVDFAVLFAKYVLSNGRYKDCAYGILHNQGTRQLAKKLVRDRNVIIPGLVEPPVREKFIERVESFAELYFVKLHESVAEVKEGP